MVFLCSSHYENLFVLLSANQKHQSETPKLVDCFKVPPPPPFMVAEAVIKIAEFFRKKKQEVLYVKLSI